MREPMTCLEARRELLADPARPPAPLRVHIAECATCAAAARRAERDDERLRDALAVPVPEGLADRLLLAQTTRGRAGFRRAFFAMAATVVLSLSAALAWQFGVAPVNEARALERYVVEHIHHEPEALTSTERVPRRAIEAALADYGLELAGDMKDVTFAARCPTPSGVGLHFVVRTGQGPVTLIYMPGQSVGRRVTVNADGFAGHVAQFREGALAVVGAPGQALEEVASRVRAGMVPARG